MSEERDKAEGALRAHFLLVAENRRLRKTLHEIHDYAQLEPRLSGIRVFRSAKAALENRPFVSPWPVRR